ERRREARQEARRPRRGVSLQAGARLLEARRRRSQERGGEGMSGQTCRCNCGYACDRKCGLEIMDCMERHYKRDCEHDFKGPLKDHGGGMFTVNCSKCDLSALSHDFMCGP